MRYSGFVIELKNPRGSGTASQIQKETLFTYARNNFKTMLSNSYDDIVLSIIDYMANTQICCAYCQRKFKTEQSLQAHITHFHRCLNFEIWESKTAMFESVLVMAAVRMF